MPPTPIDLEPFKVDIIEARHIEGLNLQAIANMLQEEYGVGVTIRTIQRRLKAWGSPSTLTIQTEEDKQTLGARIAYHFLINLFSDRQISDALRVEKLPLSPRTLQRYRKKLGLIRRRSRPQKEAQMADLRAFVKEHIDKGSVENLGKQLLTNHFRLHGVWASRNDIQELSRELNKPGIDRRLEMKRAKDGEYIVPGPDWTWCCDQHDKFSKWGIKIYAAIDTYSRKVIWYYVGIANRTQFSVLAQFLREVRQRGYIPYKIRTDHGGEVSWMAEVHYSLHRLRQPDIPFSKVFIMTKSTDNVRIEGWWGQLERGMLVGWRDWLTELTLSHRYNGTLSNEIAMLAVYLPIVRAVVKSYVHIWNTHTIRKQNHRPGSVHGQPNYLYDYAPNIPRFRHAVDNALLDELESDYAGWEIDRYLPDETLQWCNTALADFGIDLPGLHEGLNSGQVGANGDKAHVTAYLTLRELLRRHIDGKFEPKLGVCPVVTIDVKEAQQNGSRIGELIRENIDHVEEVRQNGGNFQEAVIFEGADYVGEDIDAGWLNEIVERHDGLYGQQRKARPIIDLTSDNDTPERPRLPSLPRPPPIPKIEDEHREGASVGSSPVASRFLYNAPRANTAPLLSRDTVAGRLRNEHLLSYGKQNKRNAGSDSVSLVPNLRNEIKGTLTCGRCTYWYESEFDRDAGNRSRAETIVERQFAIKTNPAVPWTQGHWSYIRELVDSMGAELRGPWKKALDNPDFPGFIRMSTGSAGTVEDGRTFPHSVDIAGLDNMQSFSDLYGVLNLDQRTKHGGSGFQVHLVLYSENSKKTADMIEEDIQERRYRAKAKAEASQAAKKIKIEPETQGGRKRKQKEVVVKEEPGVGSSARKKKNQAHVRRRAAEILEGYGSEDTTTTLRKATKPQKETQMRSIGGPPAKVSYGQTNTNFVGGESDDDESFYRAADEAHRRFPGIPTARLRDDSERRQIGTGDDDVIQATFENDTQAAIRRSLQDSNMLSSPAGVNVPARPAIGRPSTQRQTNGSDEEENDEDTDNGPNESPSQRKRNQFLSAVGKKTPAGQSAPINAQAPMAPAKAMRAEAVRREEIKGTRRSRRAAGQDPLAVVGASPINGKS